jgi:CheY-like chemotaxis protein
MQDNSIDVENGESCDRHSKAGARRILVVDDDAGASLAVEDMLKLLGHDALVCRRAQEAITHVQSQKFDLILIDYRMPELTGLDLVSMLRLDGCEVPIMMMTGYPETSERISPKQHGVSAILRKPLTIPLLAESLENVFKGPAIAET